MAQATIDVVPAPGEAPMISRRSVALVGAIAVLWSLLAWFAVEHQLAVRTAALVARETSEIQQSVVIISANVDRALNRLQGVAAVLAGMSEVRNVFATFGPDARPSQLPYEPRKSEWVRRADLLSLSRQLHAAAADIGVDVIWLMNASGDCVAASNAAEPMSFVGTNYADRNYFTSTQAGRPGRQYAVGRVTKVPGLFFSAPVVADGRFLGAVAVKSDLPKLASAVNHPNAFVSDDQGVIILAADRSLEMRALPGATVHQLPAEQRLSRYMRLQFDTYDMGTGSEPGGLLQVTGSPDPHIAARSELPLHGVTVHILMPIKDIAVLRDDAFVAFLLLCSSGIMLTILAFGARAYVVRARQYRRSMEATNESLGRLNGQLETLVMVDPLTGLHNRRFMDAILEREVTRAQRKGTQLAVIMVDIDHFKRFNDTFGHAMGDALLRALGELMEQHFRFSDVACRYGGEEFVIVLPEITLENARKRGEALRLAVHGLKTLDGGKVFTQFTVSLGLAMLPQDGTEAAALIAAADAAMYEAKQRGRDQLVVCGGARIAEQAGA
jgi:diguanylate cyclase (GGDEF)-like protein